MRKLKVFGGMTFERTDKRKEQVRAIVATTSERRVAEIIGESLYFVRNYWRIIENDKEIELAMSKPETMFYCSLVDKWAHNEKWYEKGKTNEGRSNHM